MQTYIVYGWNLGKRYTELIEANNMELAFTIGKRLISQRVNDTKDFSWRIFSSSN